MEDTNDRLSPDQMPQNFIRLGKTSKKGGKEQKYPQRMNQTGTRLSIDVRRGKVVGALSIICLYDYMRRRAGGKLWPMYRNAQGAGVSHDDVIVLMQLKAYLSFHGRDITGFQGFLGNHTGNGKYKRVFARKVIICIQKGLIGEAVYIRNGRAKSIGLTRLGLHVLRSYEEELVRLMAHYWPVDDYVVGPMDQAPTLHQYQVLRMGAKNPY